MGEHTPTEGEREAERVPTGVDSKVPNVARIYDYMLGGKDNFAADREAAEQIIKAFPESRDGVRHNREFLGNVVRHLAGEAGIRQFIDIGAGLPTQSNVHEVAHSIAPDARVVYVDNDPVVCVHGRALLANSPTVAIVEGDLLRPEEIWEQAVAGGLIDPGKPVAVLLMAMLHFIPDPYDQVAKLREMMAPGSYLAISHMTAGESRSDDTGKLTEVYEHSNAALFPRTVSEIKRFFGDFEFLDTDAFISSHLQREFAMLGWGGLARKP
ncbi:O-methyltransferase involved in polyketide biosynthesis [Thermocatellispora tengchongensis]|uniref:O-methyltransferase involved in polyketide biosynthesis n=1 Tax=Thermocatellispora tengchongensis TaxID=1073253 RepID=A0A840PJG9_9ACTN|nr:SAM-dependent methyltransferase [Thermocatellispora tengchongensis]MBB5138063.1 O-methyltransferase involved in polyketide biosynthesis [Thermocatellispora tengchongensis]